jgi:hypothetical protein
VNNRRRFSTSDGSAAVAESSGVPEPRVAAVTPGGVLIGFIAEINDHGVPCVLIPGSDDAVPARSLCPVDATQRGRQCALLFENGDPRAPLILGLLQHPVLSLQGQPDQAQHHEHGELHLRAEHAIELHCGEASLRMTADGRIELRGRTLVSHASGMNRIRGASVKLN